MILKLLFWFAFVIAAYTYLGYALLLCLLVQFKNFFKSKSTEELPKNFEPEVCLFVAALNEKDYLKQKLENSFSLNYPSDKLQFIWVTDGSDDGSQELLQAHQQLEVYHAAERKGKMHAINRGMKFVRAPIVIFSDANAMLGKDAIREITRPFADDKVGVVAGEKRIEAGYQDAASLGEGLYWKFESWIKTLDNKLYSNVGAVGELFAIRTEFFDELEPDTLLDDFMISMRIAQKGKKIVYVPTAYAQEAASENVAEELKRKIRIAAGGLQSIFRLWGLLNPLKFGLLSWQFFSHKILRWTLGPLSVFLLFVANGLLVAQQHVWFDATFFSLFFYAQVTIYLFAAFGWYFENRNMRFRFFYLAYYFVMINVAALLGMNRYFRRGQSVKWEKSKRKPA